MTIPQIATTLNIYLSELIMELMAILKPLNLFTMRKGLSDLSTLSERRPLIAVFYDYKSVAFANRLVVRMSCIEISSTKKSRQFHMSHKYAFRPLPLKEVDTNP